VENDVWWTEKYFRFSLLEISQHVPTELELLLKCYDNYANLFKHLGVENYMLAQVNDKNTVMKKTRLKTVPKID
jgi:hypothetical protein